jgi:hypothetical protein
MVCASRGSVRCDRDWSSQSFDKETSSITTVLVRFLTAVYLATMVGELMIAEMASEYLEQIGGLAMFCGI